MLMKNVLLVDTNFSSAPIYEFLIRSDYKVTVVGANPNDALAKYVDDYVNIDYSDIEKVKKLISEKKIDFLVPGCNDQSYMVCAEINEDGQFPGIDSLKTSQIINDKKKFRAFASDNQLAVPRVLIENEIGTRWPVIIKPIDSFSGKGVTVIHESDKYNLSSARDHARKVSKAGECIVEDYIDGQLYSHSAFVQDGIIFADHIVEEHGTSNPFTVDTSRVVYDFPEALLAKVRADIGLLINKLKLKDGLVHTQFIRSGDVCWIIEVTRRCPGDLYSQLIELSTGFNYVENYVLPFVSLRNRPNLEFKTKWIMRHTLSQPFEYVFGSISFNLPLHIIKMVPIAQTGDKLKQSQFGRIAILFVETKVQEDLDAIFERTLDRRLYLVKS